MPCWKDVLIIVCELFSTYRTNYMVGPRFRLFYYLRPLLCWCKFPRLFSKIIEIFLIQKPFILLSKFPFFLQLEYRGAKRCPYIELRYIKLSNIDTWTQTHFQLLLLSSRVTLKEVYLVCILVFVCSISRRCHMSCQSARSEAWYTECLHLCFLCLTFSLR